MSDEVKKTILYVGLDNVTFKQNATIRNTGNKIVYVRAQSVNIELKPGETRPLSHDFFLQINSSGFGEVEIIE